MECINMFDQQDLEGPHHGGRRGSGTPSASQQPPPPQQLVGPRISFSNDFSLDASGHPSVRYERRAPVAVSAPSDFEFSVGNHSMMAADELFSKGRLRPLREQPPRPAPRMKRTTTTLRDELLAGETEGGLTFSPSSSSSSSSGLMARVPLKWKTLMGLRKGSSDDKKIDKEAR